MTFELRDNSGSIWTNDKKEKDTHPDRTGTVMVGGVTYWISGWIKETQQGKKYLRLAFKPKEERQEQESPPQRRSNTVPGYAKAPPRPAAVDPEDDLPF